MKHFITFSDKTYTEQLLYLQNITIG
jgi:hypothetical protein